MVGCNTVTQNLICNEVEENTIGVRELCEVSFTFNRCRCRQIDFETFNAITKFQPYPIEYCEGLAGFKEVDWAEMKPKIRSLSRLKKERCQK